MAIPIDSERSSFILQLNQGGKIQGEKRSAGARFWTQGRASYSWGREGLRAIYVSAYVLWLQGDDRLGAGDRNELAREIEMRLAQGMRSSLPCSLG